jgi:hypothetical protein
MTFHQICYALSVLIRFFPTNESGQNIEDKQEKTYQAEASVNEIFRQRQNSSRQDASGRECYEIDRPKRKTAPQKAVRKMVMP